MATLEREVSSSLSAVESAEARGPTTVVADVPAPFPADELVALRTQGDSEHEEQPIRYSVDGHPLPPSYEDDQFTDGHHHPHAHGPHSHQHGRHPSNSVPPTYAHEDRPSYSHDTQAVPPEKTSAPSAEAESSRQATTTSEKMRLDLDTVTAAISHLYEVAPQMADQRVELNAKKRDEMELARMVGRGSMLDQRADSKGKATETREAELARIWESIEQAHGKRLSQQEAESGPSTSASASKEKEQKVRRVGQGASRGMVGTEQASRAHEGGEHRAVDRPQL